MKSKSPKKILSDNLSKSYDSKNLKVFPSYSQMSKYSKLTFNRNPIKSFLTFPTLENLKTLELSNTEIESFEGAKKQPQLESISIRSSPISNQKFFIEMCLISFGNQITSINGKPVTKKQHKFVTENGDMLSPFINQGWIITSLQPNIHIFQMQTRTRKILYYRKETNSVKSPNDSKIHINKSQSDLQSKINNSINDTYNESVVENEQKTSTQPMPNITYEKPIKLSKSSRCYQLTDFELDLLTENLIELSQKWNDLSKYSISQTAYDETEFDDPFLFDEKESDESSLSLIQVRRMVQRSMKYRPVRVASNSPFKQSNKSYYVQKKEEEKRRKEEKRQEMLRKQLEEEEEEEEISEPEIVINRIEMHHKNILEQLHRTWDNFERINHEIPETTEKEPAEISEKPEEKDSEQIEHPEIHVDQQQEKIESDKHYEDEISSHQTSESEKDDVFKRRRITSLTRFILNTNKKRQSGGESNQSESESDMMPMAKRTNSSFVIPKQEQPKKRIPIARGQSLKQFEYAQKILSESAISDALFNKSDEDLFNKEDDSKPLNVKAIKRERRKSSIPVPPNINQFKDQMMLKHLQARMLSDMSADEMDRLTDDEIIKTKITQKKLEDYYQAADNILSKTHHTGEGNTISSENIDDEVAPVPRKKFRGYPKTRTFSVTSMKPPIPTIPRTANLPKIPVPPLSQTLSYYSQSKPRADEETNIKLEQSRESSTSEATFGGTPPNSPPQISPIRSNQILLPSNFQTDSESDHILDLHDTNNDELSDNNELLNNNDDPTIHNNDNEEERIIDDIHEPKNPEGELKK